MYNTVYAIPILSLRFLHHPYIPSFLICRIFYIYTCAHMAHYSLMHVFSYNHINDLKKDETSSYVRFPNYSSQKTFKNTKRFDCSTAVLFSGDVQIW